MVPDYLNAMVNTSDDVEFKFNFLTQKDKLNVEVVDLKTHVKYVGEILAHPSVDFQIMKDMFEEREYKVLQKNVGFLKMRIGFMTLQMAAKSNSQTQELKDMIQKQIQKQKQFEKFIINQKDKNDEQQLMIRTLQRTINDLKQRLMKSFEQKIGSIETKILKQQSNFEELLNVKSSALQKQLQSQRNEVNQFKQAFSDIQDKIRQDTSKTQSQIKSLSLKISEGLKTIEAIDFNQIKNKTQQNEIKMDQMNNRLLQLQQLNIQKKIFEFECKLRQNQKAIDQITRQMDRNKRLIQDHTIELKDKEIKIGEITTKILKSESLIQIKQPKIDKSQNDIQRHPNKSKQKIDKKNQLFKIQKGIAYEFPELQRFHDFKAQQEKLKSIDQETPFSSPLIKSKWSDIPKSRYHRINGNIIEFRQKKNQDSFALLETGFSQEVKKKQCWGFKIYKLGSQISIGICLKKVIQKKKFDCKNIRGKYFYAVSSRGTSPQKQFQGECQYFRFQEGDLIYCEYDPIEMMMRWRRNNYSQIFKMRILPPPPDDAHHPCIINRGSVVHGFYIFQFNQSSVVELVTSQ